MAHLETGDQSMTSLIRGDVRRSVIVQEVWLYRSSAAASEVPMQKRLFPGDWRPVKSERFHDSSAQFHMQGFYEASFHIYGLCVATTSYRVTAAGNITTYGQPLLQASLGLFGSSLRRLRNILQNKKRQALMAPDAEGTRSM